MQLSAFVISACVLAATARPIGGIGGGSVVGDIGGIGGIGGSPVPRSGEWASSNTMYTR